MTKRLNVFIDGSIGVGKTTTVELLSKLLEGSRVYVIKEYIDLDPEIGAKKLEMNLKEELSDYDFQSYIIGCTERQLHSIEFETARIVIWERHPLKGLEVFGKSKLSPTDYIKLRMKLEGLLEHYGVESDPWFTNFDTSSLSPLFVAEAILREIGEAFIQDAAYIAIRLKCSNIYEQQKRIMERGRDIEKFVYSDIDKLIKVNDKYN